MVYCIINYPEKKAKVLELLTQEGLISTNENLSPNSSLKRSKFNSPLKKLHEMISSSPRPRTKKIESPSALGRRRALQRLDSSLEDTGHERSLETSFQRPSNAHQVPYNEILKGLIIYCEVRSNGVDRSSSIKTMVGALGATVREKITRDVTHVIFKDGLYSTFRKAQNMKMHIVSVLWLDAVRRYKCKMPEHKYKPLDFDKYNNMNEVQVCQEIEEEFNDVLTDEIKRSAEKKPQHDRRNLSIASFSSNDSEEENNLANDHDDKDDNNRPGFITPSNPSSRSSRCSTPSVSNTILNTSKNNNINNKDVVPCSQNDSHSFTHTRKSANLSRVVEETFHGESISRTSSPSPSSKPKTKSSNLAKHVRDSFELKKVQKLKSPPSHETSAESLKNQSRRSSAAKISITDEESMNLHVTTTTDQSLNNTRKRSTSSSNFAQKFLTSDPTTNNNSINSVNNRISDGSNTNSTNLLNGPISNKKQRRATVGLSRSKKSSVTSSLEQAPIEKTDKNENVGLNQKADNVPNDQGTVNGITTTTKKGKARKLFKGDHVDESLFNWDKAVELPPMETCTTPLKKRKVEIPHDFPRNLSSKARKKVSTAKKTTARKLNVNNNIPAKGALAKILQFGEKEGAAGDNQQTTSGSNTKNSTSTIAGIQSIEDISNEDSTKPKKRLLRKSINPKKNKAVSSSDGDSDHGAEIPTITDKRPKRKSIAPIDYKKLAAFTDDSEEDQPATKKPNKMTNGNKTDESYTTAKSNLSSAEKINRRKSKRLTISSISSGNSEGENFSPTNVTSPKNNKRKTRHTISSISSGNSCVNSSPKVLKTTPPKTRRQSIVKSTPVSKIKATPIRSTRLSSVIKEINSPKTPNVRKKPPKTPQTDNKILTKARNSERTPNRRSTMEFMPRSSRKSLARIKAAEEPKAAPAKISSIVCTRFHRADTQVFAQIVSKLGRFVVEDEVTKRTTHLVCGGPIRTINLLRAIARGCWILRKEWLYKSLEVGRWLEEEDYEMVEFSPAIQKCRLEKQAFGPLYSMDLFKNCGPIFISRGSNPRSSDLEELVQLCGGRIVRIVRDADIIVGEKVRHDNYRCFSVTEKWILDSITDNKKKNFKHYEILNTDT